MTKTMPFDVRIVPVTPFQQNCSIIRAKNGEVAIVDPGGEVDRLLRVVSDWGGRVTKIWLTHGHLDHAAGAMELKRRTGAPIEGPQAEEIFWLGQMAAQAARFGADFGSENVEPDRWLTHGDEVELADMRFAVLYTPGHTPGHVVFHSADAELAFVGDVLFQGSIGRTDFPRGDHATLLRSITGVLWPLGDATRFVPGHGPMSTFGAERATNPYVGDRVIHAAAQNRTGPG